MITPLRKRIIAEPVIDKQSGVVEIPDEYKQSQTVNVVAVGPEVTVPIKVGDRVLLHPNAAWTNVEHEGKALRMINEEFLLAVFE